MLGDAQWSELEPLRRASLRYFFHRLATALSAAERRDVLHGTGGSPSGRAALRR
jgi:hypothetical protein